MPMGKKINRSHTHTPTENNTPDTDTHTTRRNHDLLFSFQAAIEPYVFEWIAERRGDSKHYVYNSSLPLYSPLLS